MIEVRQKDHRGTTEIDWLKSFHSFSFGEYRDINNMGFGPLRVINEDYVNAGAGFHTHGHANMEIITYVLSGALEHKDSLGSGDVIRPGDVQLMSAGKGIMHSEFNPSETDSVHLLQIWIMPKVTGTKPTYQQTSFPAESYENRLNLVVSPDGAEGSLTILQDARLWITRLDAGKSVDLPLNAGKKYWIQLAKGAINTGGKKLLAGDGLAIDKSGDTLHIQAIDAAEAVIFELPQ